MEMNMSLSNAQAQWIQSIDLDRLKKQIACIKRRR